MFLTLLLTLNSSTIWVIVDIILGIQYSTHSGSNFGLFFIICIHIIIGWLAIGGLGDCAIFGTPGATFGTIGLKLAGGRF